MMKRCHCGNLFPQYHGQRHCSFNCYLSSSLFPRAGVTVDDVISCAGMLQKDAAYLLGVSYPQFRRKVRNNPELRRLFPSAGGESQQVARHGYTGKK